MSSLLHHENSSGVKKARFYARNLFFLSQEDFSEAKQAHFCAVKCFLRPNKVAFKPGIFFEAKYSRFIAKNIFERQKKGFLNQEYFCETKQNHY